MNKITEWTGDMNAVLRAVSSECAYRLRDTDLRGGQMFYLLSVCRMPNLSQDRLAGQLGVDESNVTRQLTDLEQKGYVRRHRDEQDGRRWLVEPTDRAYEMLPLFSDVLSDVRELLTRDLSHEEQELFGELIQKMARNAARRSAQREGEKKR